MSKPRKPARTAEQRAADALFAKSRANVDRALATLQIRRDAIRVRINEVRVQLDALESLLTENCTDIPVEYMEPLSVADVIRDFHSSVFALEREQSKHNHVCELLGDAAGPRAG